MIRWNRPISSPNNFGRLFTGRFEHCDIAAGHEYAARAHQRHDAQRLGSRQDLRRSGQCHRQIVIERVEPVRPVERDTRYRRLLRRPTPRFCFGIAILPQCPRHTRVFVIPARLI